MKERHDELIDKYLKNTLTEVEQADFLSLMNEDPVLKKQVFEKKKVITAAKALKREQLRKQLKQAVERMDDSERNSLKWWWAAAASFILALSLGYFFLFHTTTDQLYNKYYEPYPALSVQRGSATEVNKGLKFYSEGMYQEAITALEKNIEDSNPTFYLYLGNSYLNIHEYEKAIEAFSTLPNQSDDTILKQHAEWYIALTYLKMEDLNNARITLNRIISNQGLYKDPAQKLLNKID